MSVDSNKKIIDLIKKNSPFSVVRLGMGPETYITLDYLKNDYINTNYLHPTLLTLYNAGIYSRNKDLNKIKLFCHSYNDAIKKSDILARFLGRMNEEQDYFVNKYNLQQITSRTLEPFYVMKDNIIPWSHLLKSKKVLIVNPFVESFKKQINNNFKFKVNGMPIFLDDQEFVFYKSYQTIAGNHIHNDWFETFTLMCNDIKKLDFDIALLSCGGYGLPLCNFIKHNLNKSAIYVGGGLQLFFGVMGNRWKNHDQILNIIGKNIDNFIYPSEEERCPNMKTIEGGCFW